MKEHPLLSLFVPTTWPRIAAYCGVVTAGNFTHIMGGALGEKARDSDRKAAQIGIPALGVGTVAAFAGMKTSSSRPVRMICGLAGTAGTAILTSVTYWRAVESPD